MFISARKRQALLGYAVLISLTIFTVILTVPVFAVNLTGTEQTMENDSTATTNSVKANSIGDEANATAQVQSSELTKENSIQDLKNSKDSNKSTGSDATVPMTTLVGLLTGACVLGKSFNKNEAKSSGQQRSNDESAQAERSLNHARNLLSADNDRITYEQWKNMPADQLRSQDYSDYEARYKAEYAKAQEKYGPLSGKTPYEFSPVKDDVASYTLLADQFKQPGDKAKYLDAYSTKATTNVGVTSTGASAKLLEKPEEKLSYYNWLMTRENHSGDPQYADYEKRKMEEDKAYFSNPNTKYDPYPFIASTGYSAYSLPDGCTHDTLR